MTVAVQNEKETSLQSDEENSQETIQEEDPLFDLDVSGNRLEATLGLLNADKVKTISFEAVVNFLNDNKVAFGLLEESIHQFCESGVYTKRFVCAKGTPPVDGGDGSLDFKINTKKELKPKERENGTVDYRNLEIVENVHEGDVLCQLIPPTPGKDGTDVYNETIPFTPGRTPSFPSGTNTVQSEDGLSLLSRVDGSVEYKNAQINVKDVYIVHGDVNCNTGNINSICSVIIQGDVMEGFCVKSEKDITIRGMAEGAQVEAEGNITLSSGMIGMGHGILKAGGTVSAKYFENATIIAKGDIVAGNMMNCRAETEGSILIKGKNASLIGGSYTAGKTIIAKTVGNSGYTKTAVTISCKELNDIYTMNDGSNSYEELKTKLSEFQVAKDKLQQQIDAVESSLTEEDQAKMTPKKAWLKAASDKSSQIDVAIQALQKHIEQDEQNNMELCDYKIMVSGIAYPGVTVKIGPYDLKLRQENSCTKFYGNVDRVVFTPLVQGEIEI